MAFAPTDENDRRRDERRAERTLFQIEELCPGIALLAPMVLPNNAVYT